MSMIRTFDELINHVQSLETRTIAIANAQDEAALSAFIEAEKLSMVTGKLFGDQFVIERMLQELAPKLISKVEIIDCSDENKALKEAVLSVHNRQANIWRHRQQCLSSGGPGHRHDDAVMERSVQF